MFLREPLVVVTVLISGRRIVHVSSGHRLLVSTISLTDPFVDIFYSRIFEVCEIMVLEVSMVVDCELEQEPRFESQYA